MNLPARARFASEHEGHVHEEWHEKEKLRTIKLIILPLAHHFSARISPMKRFVTVLIRGTRKTTEICVVEGEEWKCDYQPMSEVRDHFFSAASIITTNKFPTNPTKKTAKYAMHIAIDIVDE